MNIGDTETNFLALWEEGSLCDVELCTGDGALVHSHKVVLAAVSPFFRAIFVGSGRLFREGSSGSTPIDLPGIDESSLKQLLRVIYSNSTSEIDAESVPNLLAAASYLSVGAVREACAEYMKRSLSLATAVEALVLAEQYDIKELRMDAMQYLQAHFIPLLQSAHSITLQQLPLNLLEELLSSSELEVTNESDVAFAGALWMLGDVAQRAEHAMVVLATTREPLTPNACAAAVDAAVSSLNTARPSMDDIHAVHAAMTTAAAALLDPSAPQHIAGPMSLSSASPGRIFSPRHGSPTELMALGGLDEGWRSLKTVELYDPRKDEWRVGPAMWAPCSFAAACTLGTHTYAIEGSAHLPTPQLYDRQKKRWRHFQKPLIARVNMAAAALPSSGIYVLGGRAGTGRAGVSLNSVDRFDPEAFTWGEAAPMNACRASLAACALDGQKIFAIGGQSDRATHDSAEWFDPGSNQWYEIESKMTCPRKYLGAAAVAGQVVALGGLTSARQRLASCEAYDPREGRWRALPAMDMPRSSCGVAVLHGEIFVAGGSVGEGTAFKGVECFSVTAGKWRKCATLATGRSGLAMAPV